MSSYTKNFTEIYISMNKCMHVEWNKKALHHQLDMVPRGTYIASGTFPIKKKLSNALQPLTRKGKKKT